MGDHSPFAHSDRHRHVLEHVATLWECVGSKLRFSDLRPFDNVTQNKKPEFLSFDPKEVLLLLRCGYDYAPYASLERIVEISKDTYYRSLRSAQRGIRTSDEDLGDWVLFFLRALDSQRKVLTAKVEQEKSLEALPALSEQLLEIARDRGQLTIAVAVKLTGANRNTVKVHLRSLLEGGRLRLHGKGKGAWYTAI